MKKRFQDSFLYPYLYVVKFRLLAALAYRFEVFTGLGVNAILMLATVFLWQTAYEGVETVAQVQESQMISYAIAMVLLRSISSYDVQNTINMRVRSGEIAVDFIKPVNLILYWLAEDVGRAISTLGLYLLPLIAVSGVLFYVPLPATLPSFAVFVASCLLSFGILWLMSALVGMVSFWAAELGDLGILKDTIVTALSGSLVPLWFFPEVVQRISRYLPFQYTYQTPLAIYIGRTAPSEVGGALLVQGVWVVALALLLGVVWRRAARKVMIQGG